MLGSLQLVSGLPRENAGEASLVDALSSLGVEFDRSWLCERESALREGVRPRVIVLILPLLGDNDLNDDTRLHVARLVTRHSHLNCAFVVVGHGDRHVSDEFVAPNTPFSIKVRHLFSRVGAFELLATKLDRFTAVASAREIADFVDTTSFSDISNLNAIARLLPRAPTWQASKHLLDFFDGSMGSSLLQPVERVTMKAIASHVEAIAPRILKMAHAGFRDDALPDVARALQAEVMDLGSNQFSWDGLAPQLGACRWLGLAANHLKRVQLSLLPGQLEHLYLHKNNLDELLVKPADVARLKSLSLYRNRLAVFDWPAGQTTLARLNLGANPISLLPETLADCVALESLGLARTKLAGLPEWVFLLPRLRELDVSYIEDRIPTTQIAQLRSRGVSLITRPGLTL